MPNLRICFIFLWLISFGKGYGQQGDITDFHRGQALYDRGYYDSATFFLQRYVQQGDSLNPEALALYGETLSQAGRQDEALEVLGILKKVAEDSQQVYYETKALLQIGDVQLRQGQIQLAYETYQQALLKNGVHKGDSVSALIFQKVGFALFSMGKYETAQKFALQSRKIMNPLQETKHDDWAGFYKLMGAIYDRQAQYDSALYYYEKSLAANIRLHGEHHPETAKLWANMANIYHVQGANVQAEKYFQLALKTLQEFLGKDHILVATIYNNMGIIDFDMGNFDKAIVYYEKALNTYRKKIGEQSLPVAQIQNNMASAYLEMKNPQQALLFARQSLKTRQQQLDADNMLLAPVYVNLTGAYILLHQYGKANSYSNKAIHIYASHGETNHPGMAESYTGLGESYLSQQQYGKALAFFYKAKSISLQLYGPHHAKLAYIENLLGKTFLEQHQADSALLHYDLALDAVVPGYQPDGIRSLPEISKNPYLAQHFLLEALKGKAETLYIQYQDQPEEKEQNLRSAYAIYNYLSGLIDDMRNAYQREESKLFLSQMASPVYERALDVTWNLYQHTKDPAFARQAFTFSEKSKYALLSDFMNDVAAKYAAGIPQEVLEKEQRFKSRIAYYEKQIFEAPNDSIRQQYAPLLTELNKGYMDFVNDLEKGYPEYYRMKYNPRTASVKEVQKVLEPDEELVEYAVTDQALYTFSIQPDSLAFMKTALGEPLDSLVMRMRKGLTEQRFSLYTKNAWKLDSILTKSWKGKEGKVIIIPDKVLGYLPFEVLLTKKVISNTTGYWQLPYLVKDHTMSYNYSATLYLADLNKQNSISFRSFMVGFAPGFPAGPNPIAMADTGQTDRSGLLKLEGAQRELKKVAELFQGKFFFGQDATEANFKKAIKDSRLIHLSTHGILDDEHPDLSRLVFSNTKDTVEDNMLHTYEIYNLKLNAELITLSACNTGSGQLREGEGVMSLARAFSYAGCPNIVTSLWPAPDYATAQLMQRFYYYLSNGWEKDEALHQAKLDYLADADENLASPTSGAALCW